MNKNKSQVIAVITFIACLVAAFLITRSIKGIEKPIISSPTIEKDTAKDTITPPIVIENDKKQKEKDKKEEIEDKKKKEESKIEETPQEKVIVEMDKDEMKAIIRSQNYESEFKKRLSRKYDVKFINQRDGEHIQNNFEALNEAIDYGTWKDFHVISIGYDDQGKVNLVTVEPVY